MQMLLLSRRHTKADLTVWNQLARMDRINAQAPRMRGLVCRAHDAIKLFYSHHEGDCYCGVSWGKDSITVAHMIATLGLQIPLMWLRFGVLTNPDCIAVRDVFLSMFPGVIYHEAKVPYISDGCEWWLDASSFSAVFSKAARDIGGAHISGVRMEEAGIRRLRMHVWGLESPNTCAPIGYWRNEDVFAYMSLHDLPIHPAYACSAGGVFPRNRLRVDMIGGEGGETLGRGEWEARYYPEVIGSARRAARGGI